MYDYILDFLLAVNTIGLLVMWWNGCYQTAPREHSCSGVLKNIRYGFYK